MHTFYCENISNVASLSEIDSKHATKVLRLSTGDQVRLINGKGSEAFGRISVPHSKQCEIAIDQLIEHPKKNKEVIIALAPTKNNDRTEWFLEKATEIGITQFIPIICDNSERKKFNLERWQKIMVSALKQSKRLWAPIIHNPISLKEIIISTKDELLFIAHCEDGNKKELKDFADSKKDQIILIGPEGDFSPAEIQIAIENNFIPVSLGENRLRTETAGVVACTLMTFN